VSTPAPEPEAEAEEKVEALPSLFTHSCDVYQAMLEKATAVQLSEEEGGGTMIVYEGFLTQLFKELRLSVPYFTSVTQELKRMNCIRQLRRGGGQAPSQWELVRAPSEELWRETEPMNKPGKSRLDILEQKVRDLTAQLNDAQLPELKATVAELARKVL